MYACVGLKKYCGRAKKLRMKTILVPLDQRFIFSKIKIDRNVIVHLPGDETDFSEIWQVGINKFDK